MAALQIAMTLSALFSGGTSWRSISLMKSARKHVICSRKLKRIARPAYSENVRTAGMEDMAPRKKQTHSDRLVSSIDGTTSPQMCAIRSSRGRMLSSFRLCNAGCDLLLFCREYLISLDEDEDVVDTHS